MQVFVLSLALISWAALLDLTEYWEKNRLIKLTGGSAANEFDVGIHPSVLLSFIANATGQEIQTYNSLRSRILDCKSSINYDTLWTGMLQMVHLGSLDLRTYDPDSAKYNRNIWRLCAFLKTPINPRIMHSLRCLMDETAFNLAMNFLVLHATDAEKMRLGGLVAALADHAQSAKGASAAVNGNKETTMRNVGATFSLAGPKRLMAQPRDTTKRVTVQSLDHLAGTVLRRLRIGSSIEPNVCINEIFQWRLQGAAVLLQRVVRRWLNGKKIVGIDVVADGLRRKLAVKQIDSKASADSHLKTGMPPIGMCAEMHQHTGVGVAATDVQELQQEVICLSKAWIPFQIVGFHVCCRRCSGSTSLSCL